jgi:hypothetical protein
MIIKKEDIGDREIVKIGDPHDPNEDRECLIDKKWDFDFPFEGMCCCICQNQNDEFTWYLDNGDGRVVELYCWAHGICEFFIDGEPEAMKNCEIAMEIAMSEMSCRHMQ